MRDGIFKTAPLSKKWHAVGRCAEREADHGERLVDVLSEALKDDIPKEIAEGLKGLVGIVRGGRFSILTGEDLKFFANSIKPGSRFAKDVLGTIQFICRGGKLFNPQALIDAVSRSSQSHAEAMKAEMLGHANRKTDKVHLAKVADGFNNAIKNLDYHKIASDVFFPSKNKDVKTDHSFDLNENLLG
jgi:hypothetical protein